MTNDEKRRAIAEFCGWSYIEVRQGVWLGLRPNKADYEIPQRLPSYLESLDAIRAAVLEQSEEFQRLFNYKLADLMFGNKMFHQLSAEDWSTVFLEVVNKSEKRKENYEHDP